MVNLYRRRMPMKKLNVIPNDGQLWRVEWIGGVSYSRYESPNIRIYFSKITDKYSCGKFHQEYYLFKNSSSSYDHFYKDVSVELMRFLRIGTIWKDDIEQNLYIEGFRCNVGFDISPNEPPAIIKLNKHGQDAHTLEELITDEFDFIADSTIKEDSFVLVIRDHPIYKKIIIPCPAIFQACYAVAPLAASKIIFGEFDKLLNPKYSGFLVDEPNVYRAHLNGDFTIGEEVELARLATDHIAQENFQLLRNSIIASRNQTHPNYIHSLKVGFPYKSKIRVSAKGRIICYGINPKTKLTEYGFFVSEIQSVMTPYEFDTLLPVGPDRVSMSGTAKAERIYLLQNGMIPMSKSAETHTIELAKSNRSIFTYQNSNSDLKSKAYTPTSVVRHLNKP